MKSISGKEFAKIPSGYNGRSQSHKKTLLRSSMRAVCYDEFIRVLEKAIQQKASQ
jgi:hypothetical protein